MLSYYKYYIVTSILGGQFQEESWNPWAIYLNLFREAQAKVGVCTSSPEHAFCGKFVWMLFM